MSDKQQVNAPGPGRPLHPKWDKMNDLDRYIAYCDMILRNLVTGKWKSVPRGTNDARAAFREAMINKYPDYFKAQEPVSGNRFVEESVADLPEQPLQTDKLEQAAEEPKFTSRPWDTKE